jgi:hypothetical protein
VDRVERGPEEVRRGKRQHYAAARRLDGHDLEPGLCGRRPNGRADLGRSRVRPRPCLALD